MQCICILHSLKKSRNNNDKENKSKDIKRRNKLSKSFYNLAGEGIDLYGIYHYTCGYDINRVSSCAFFIILYAQTFFLLNG